MTLIIVGGTLQIAGFILVAIELSRVQSHEFGTPVWIQRLRGHLRRLFGHSKTIEATAAGTSSSGGSARAKVRRGRGKTLEDHVASLERNVQHIDDEIDELRADSEQWRGELLDQLHMTRAEVVTQRRADDEARKAFLRTSVLLQGWGTFLFVVGTVLGVVGSLD
jgi:hypothetical protein